MRSLLLVIADGWGVAPPSPGNAIALASTPVYDRWLAESPWTTLEASGEAVGLPAGMMGNSEVGHLNLGAGRMVPQELLRIDLSLRDGSFFENHVLVEAADRAAVSGAPLHLLGLLSDGGVHSHIRHLFGLIELAQKRGARPVVHAFTDGRDTPPRSALRYVDEVEARLAGTGGSIATVTGRYFAMDRDLHWERIAPAWAAMRQGQGRRAESAREAVEAAYAAGETDEFIAPAVIARASSPPTTLSDGDPAIFFNFRADRAREMTAVIAAPGFDAFDRGPAPRHFLATFTEYKKELDLPVAFPPLELSRILAQVWAEEGVPNLRVAETEKYAHVTYFFNGGVEAPFPGEERILIPSWRGATYDLHPEMSAAAITAEVLRALDEGRFPAIIVNFANADMVGHTGKLAETISAIETLDRCLGALDAAARRVGAVLLFTADHGNAEQMVDPGTGQPHTAHTSNPVPLILRGPSGVTLRAGGSLADVAPTILSIQRIPAPPEMTGRSLLEKA